MNNSNDNLQFKKDFFANPERETETPPQLDEWQIKFNKLSPEVQNWMASQESATANREIAEKFNLKGDENSILAEVTSWITLKDYPISSLPELLERELSIPEEQAEEIALEVVKKQFLPLRQYMPEVEEYLNQIGEIRPKPTQSTESPLATAKEQKPPQMPEQNIQLPQKSLREAAKTNESVLDQFITFEPIIIKSAETGEEKKVSPTIRNWLRDYVIVKGSNAHTEVDRSDYLFNSPNASRLSGEERNLISEFLKSFDSPSYAIPFSPRTKLFAIEKLMKKQTGEERKIFGNQGMVEPQTQKPEPILFRPQAMSASIANGTDKYLEPIEKDSTPQNTAQSPKPPASKDQGNQGRVINLKDLS